MPSVNVKSTEFEALIDKGGIVLVDFWAEWCGPCKMFGPIFEKVSSNFPEITFAKIDTEAEREISAAAGITSIPKALIWMQFEQKFQTKRKINLSDEFSNR